MDFLEVAMVIREPHISQDEEMPLAQKYNPYFRYPVSDWREPARCATVSLTRRFIGVRSRASS